jgi:AraC family transcriptional regulator, regulatory protein of adaptative response / DNA-3-methyladenine glycosylase II
MTSFAGVVTTGIYCRPGCGARPRPDHVRLFSSAAAAEAAGYRACLRCRPYRTEAPIGEGAPELVCRAVRLILDGALDGKNERELAARLYVSVRHLRRLFQECLGVTPDQLARSARTHFARRLLDDTDLTIGDIAFASGFGSVRQLNRACQAVFRATPKELRARRRASDRLVADGGLVLRLPYRPPLDWDTMLDYLLARAIGGVECVSADVYRRTVAIDGDPGVLELSRGGPDHLLLRAHLPHWEGLIHIVRRARRILNLDAEVAAARDHLETDPIVGPLVRARPGVRPPGTWDAFETAVRAIVGHRVSVGSASTIAARIVVRHGTRVPGLNPLGLTHLFPSASTLATADLGGLGLIPARARAINDFARAVANGTIRLDPGSRLDEFVEAVMAIPGMGPWTAHYVALRLGDPDAFPAADLGIRRALSGMLGGSVSRRLAEEFGRLVEAMAGARRGPPVAGRSRLPT